VSSAPSTDSDIIALPPGVTQATVLVAGSNGYTAALGRALTQGGYDVVLAASVGQTLDLAAQQPPQLVIAAERLQGGGGRALCRAIKRQGDFIPVILLARGDDGGACDPDDAPDAVLDYAASFRDYGPLLSMLLRLKRQFDRRAAQWTAQSREIEALKDRIISNVSHELRTPLLQVKTSVSLLAEQTGRQPAFVPHNVAEMATRAVARLEGVVGNIRQLAQTHEMRLGPVSVADSAALAMRTITRSWDSRGAETRVQIRIDRRLPPVVADKRALGDLLQILIDNALKFSDEGLPVVVLAEPDGERELWVGVQDFGIGIPPEEHERIFEAFYQVDSSSTRRAGGTGTGLALAVLLATRMNTRVELRSEPGEGSLFFFRLPLADLQRSY